jgi:hypothetical protein
MLFVSAEDTSVYAFIFIAMLVVSGKAWLTPVIEGLMVNQIKRDPERGAEDLETFGMMMQSLGSIIYCIGGGALFQVKGPGGLEGPHPRNFFGLVAVVGAIILLAGIIYPNESE